MGIMAMKLKSSGLEELGLRIDNRKENPRPGQGEKLQTEGQITRKGSGQREGHSQQLEELALQERGLCGGTSIICKNTRAQAPAHRISEDPVDHGNLLLGVEV